MLKKRLTREIELTPDIEPSDENWRSLRRGRCLERFFPDYIEMVDKVIKQQAEQCKRSTGGQR